MEGMIGDNFNTFGEQDPSMFFQERKSLEEEHRGSTKLIERIEKQIEAELRENKDAASALHPMFEVHEHSNNSIETHESNPIEMVAKPPQNSLIETNQIVPNASHQATLL